MVKKCKAQRDLYAAQHVRKGGQRLAGAGHAGAMIDARRKASTSGKAREKARKEIKSFLGYDK